MPDPTPAEKAALERQVADAKAEFEQLVMRAKARFTRQIQQVKERIPFAADERRRWETQRDALAPHRTHPQGRPLFEKAELLVALYGSMQRFLELELPVHQANLALASQAAPAGGAIAFRSADDDPAYTAARQRMDAALLGFLWRMNLDGADAVLRAAGRGSAGDGVDQSAVAGKLAEDARHDLALERLLAELAGELAEVGQLVDWLAPVACGQQQGPLPAADPRWERVEAAIALMQKVHARVATQPALAKLFPKPEGVELPFGAIAEAKSTGAKGPERLALSKGRASSLSLDDFPRKQ